MPTTAEYLARLVQAKTDIATAITNKGGTVNSGDGLEEFPADIATIPTGGGDNWLKTPTLGRCLTSCSKTKSKKYWSNQIEWKGNLSISFLAQ